MPVSQRIGRIDGYWALRTKAGLFDTGERPIQIKGPDAAKFCNLVFTRDCTKIKTGRAGYGLLCYPNGKLLCDGVLLRLAEDMFWYSQADGPVFIMAHRALARPRRGDIRPRLVGSPNPGTPIAEDSRVFQRYCAPPRFQALIPP